MFGFSLPVVGLGIFGLVVIVSTVVVLGVLLVMLEDGYPF